MKDICFRHNIPYNLRPVEKWMAIPLTVLSYVLLPTTGTYMICSWKDVFWLRNYDPVAMPFAFLTVLVVLFGAGFIIKQILPAKKN